MTVGIASYACYFPPATLPADTLREVWGRAPRGLASKRVAAPDEDALTLALAAARRVSSPRTPKAVALASTTLPYATRVQAGLLVEGLGLDAAGTHVSEHTTSARAGTEALSLHAALADSREAPALVVAAETARGSASGGVDAAAGAGAAAVAVAHDGAMASLLAAQHYAAEDPGLEFSEAGDRERHDIGVPGYAAAARKRALGSLIDAVLTQLDTTLEQFRFVVTDTWDERTAQATLGAAGIDDGRWRPVWMFPRVGDLGAAGALVGLCAALDAARAGDWILVLSYGAGSAADALVLEAGETGAGGVVDRALHDSHVVDYPTYLRLRQVL